FYAAFCVVPSLVPSEFCPLSLHAALPILASAARTVARLPSDRGVMGSRMPPRIRPISSSAHLTGTGLGSTKRSKCSGSSLRWIRSEEHTSELQSRENLVCRLLLEKKNQT